MGVLLLSDLLRNWSAKDRHGLCPTIQHCKCLVLLISRNNIALHRVNYLNDQVALRQRKLNRDQLRRRTQILRCVG